MEHRKGNRAITSELRFFNTEKAELTKSQNRDKGERAKSSLVIKFCTKKERTHQRMSQTEEIVYLQTEDIHPYLKNPRQNEKAVPYVANSIREFGFKVPIVVDESHTVICGHTRLAAAKSLGLEEVPCIIATDLTQEQVQAFRLADNKVAEIAEWDEELLQDELDDLSDIFDMSDFGFFDGLDQEEEPEAYEDDYDPELTATPNAVLGDIYQLGEHRLMCGSSTDATDVEQLMNGEVADLCITDPPYNVDYKGEAGKIMNDKMGDANFYQFLYDFYGNMLAALKPGGAFYIFHADREGSNFRGALKDAGGQVKQCLIWVKNNLVLGRQDYQWKHEPCLYGWKDGGAHFFIDDRKQTTVIEDRPNLREMTKAQLIDYIKAHQDDGHASTIIHEDNPEASDLHPTMKPIKLVGRLMANSSNQGEIVVDFFGGSGSTMVAAEQLKRKAYLMELDPRFVDVIIDRWQKMTGKKAKLLNEETNPNRKKK